MARRLVELRLEVPAILALEGGRPLSVVAGQGLLFLEPMLEPIVRALLGFRDYRQFAALVERRDALDHLLHSIESRADAAHRARRADAATRRRK